MREASPPCAPIGVVTDWVLTSCSLECFLTGRYWIFVSDLFQ